MERHTLTLRLLQVLHPWDLQGAPGMVSVLAVTRAEVDFGVPHRVRYGDHSLVRVYPRAYCRPVLQNTRQVYDLPGSDDCSTFLVLDRGKLPIIISLPLRF